MSSGADSQSGGNYAYVAPPSFYDACPAGTTALAAGVTASTGSYSTMLPVWPFQPGYQITGPVSVGIGDGAGLSPGFVDGVYQSLTAKTCVGSPLGQATVTSGWGVDATTYTVEIYDRLVFIDPAATSFNINVIVNNALFRNVRPVF